MRQDFVPIVELDAEHRVGERFFYSSLELDYTLFGHGITSFGRLVRISGSASVTSKECSK